MEAAKRVSSLSRPPVATIFIVSFLLCSSILAAVARDTILPGDGMSGNQTLVSKNDVFELGFFSWGTGIQRFLGVRFKKLPNASPTFWIRDGAVITDPSSAALEVSGGNLCIKEAGDTLWCSSVAGDGLPAAAAVLLDSGNLVVRDQTNISQILWQSFDSPGDTLLPGARLGFVRETERNVSMTYKDSWHNASISVDQSRRNGFVLTTDGHDSLGTFPDWMVTSQDKGSSLILNHAGSPNATEFLQFILGQVSLMRWSEDYAAPSNSGWVSLWTFPSNCKSGAFFCGAFGACTSNGKCSCLDGYEPRYPNEWMLGSFVTGCSRSLPFSCEMNSQTEHDDSFILIDKLQGLPYYSRNYLAGSDEDCKQACFSKCYCVAYVYDFGCKLWYDKLYNVSFAARPPYNKVYVRRGSKLMAKNGLHTRAILLLVAGFMALASVILILMLLRRYKTYLFTCRKFEVEGSLAFYSYGQIKKATRNFSDKLGEGGFGSVFRGTMPGPGSTVIAVKSLKGRGHADKQFRAEVQTGGMIKHTNLVHLLGFCVKRNMRLLVYQYMPNGSLDSHLFSERSSLLNWGLRYKIALGIAKGLDYLHEGCEDCIIHCDIKPKNILLDEEFCAKISDFGMAKLLGHEFKSALTTIRGTMGYLAPEWVYGQPITKKADVYSFGIVLLEIVSGRRTTKRLKSGSHRYFPFYAAAQVNEGNVLCLLDSRLEGNANIKELDITCRVACWCIHDEENDRPSMRQVVHMLEGVVSTEIPPTPSSFQNLMEGENSSIYSDEG
ncbi:unnamed protein product [Urochloa humidicola]